MGYERGKGTVAAVSLKPIMAAVRMRHVAAGYNNPCDDVRIREANQGFRIAELELDSAQEETTAAPVGRGLADCRARRHYPSRGPAPPPLCCGSPVFADAAGQRFSHNAGRRRRAPPRRQH